MRGVVVTDTAWRKLRCSKCRKVGQPGDVMIIHPTHDNYGKPFTLPWHKMCLEEIVQDAPDTKDEINTAFETLKGRIAAGETLFGIKNEQP